MSCWWMSTADLAVDSGQCLLDRGRTEEACARIDEGLTLLPRARDRTRAVFRTYEARTFLQAREVERALAVSTGSLDLATRIGADRCHPGPRTRPRLQVLSNRWRSTRLARLRTA
jgi:hypothetical protein